MSARRHSLRFIWFLVSASGEHRRKCGHEHYLSTCTSTKPTSAASRRNDERAPSYRPRFPASDCTGSRSRARQHGTVRITIRRRTPHARGVVLGGRRRELPPSAWPMSRSRFLRRGGNFVRSDRKPDRDQIGDPLSARATSQLMPLQPHREPAAERPRSETETESGDAF